MAAATTLDELDDLIYGFDKEELRTVLYDGDKAMLEGLLKRLPEQGIDPQDYLNRLKNARENKKTPAVPLTSTENVESSAEKSVKQEKISMAIESISNDGGRMMPPKMRAPRTRRIKTEAPEAEEEESSRTTRSRNVKPSIKKESVTLQAPKIPLVDITNNIASPRRTRSKRAIEVHEKNNVDDVIKDKNVREDREEYVPPKSKLTDNKDVNKGEQQINTNSPSNDEADNMAKSTRGTCNIKETPRSKIKEKTKAQLISVQLNNGEATKQQINKETIVPPEKNPKLNSSGDKSNLNEKYNLPTESQSSTNTSAEIKQPPKKINTPAISNKTFTPLKNTKTPISISNGPCSSSTPLNTFKSSRNVFKGQDSLQKKEDLALEKSKKQKNIELQKELKLKKEAQMKQEAAKKKAELLKKMKANLAGSSKIMKTKVTYMIKNAPLLPTVDCYDTDEEYKQDPHPQHPTWVDSKLLEKEQLVGSTSGRGTINTLFIMKDACPDLQQVFEIIDAKKLVRSSSAHWKRPPRYTLFVEHGSIYFSDVED